jgi:hypothetical protein
LRNLYHKCNYFLSVDFFISQYFETWVELGRTMGGGLPNPGLTPFYKFARRDISPFQPNIF